MPTDLSIGSSKSGATTTNTNYNKTQILRKSETATLTHASKIIIVIELCTSDHNYSATLCAAEVVGKKTHEQLILQCKLIN